MKVVVVYTWARDPENAVVRADGTVDWRGAKMTPGEDDPAALAVAKAVATDGTLVGLTVGDGDASWVLARGVESAYRVSDVPPLADNAATAQVIAAAVGTIGDVDVVVIGDSQQDPGVAVAVAGWLGWPCLAGIVAADPHEGHVAATRRDGSELRALSIAPPVVLGVTATADVDRTPGMKELLAARKRPLTEWTLADVDVALSDVTSAGTRRPDITPTRVFAGEPAETAAQLVAALRADGVL